jgi:hypothetical protein
MSLTLEVDIKFKSISPGLNLSFKTVVCPINSKNAFDDIHGIYINNLITLAPIRVDA